MPPVGLAAVVEGIIDTAGGHGEHVRNGGQAEFAPDRLVLLGADRPTVYTDRRSLRLCGGGGRFVVMVMCAGWPLRGPPFAVTHRTRPRPDRPRTSRAGTAETPRLLERLAV